MEAHEPPRWSTWVALAVVVHCAFGVSRIPHAVIGKRWAEVFEFEQEGEAAWRLRNANLHGLAEIEEVRRTTPPNAVIAIGGDFENALEYVPALLWPRLCCLWGELPADSDTYLGRPIGTQAIVGEGDTLRLVPR